MSTRSFQESIEQFKFELFFVAFLGILILLLPVLAGFIWDEPKHTVAAAQRVSQKSRARAAASRAASAVPVQQATVAAATTVAQPDTAPNPTPVAHVAWPMQGRVTTEYGVPHYPWQHRHSGIDISSGRPNGSAEVRPFKAGRVIEAARGAGGLGNMVVIDHGEGLTSSYSHLASISVQVGQQVNTSDIIGREGRTGSATGPHLHLEILRNGVHKNPRQFIPGNP